MPRIGLRERMVFALLVIVVSLLIFSGYGQAQAQPGTLRISSSELFTGELKRIEPHLDFTSSGCVKIDYSGSALPVSLHLESWHNGTPTNYGAIGKYITKPAELSISVKQVSEAKEASKYQVIRAISEEDGYVSRTDQLELPGLSEEVRKRQLNAPMNIDMNNTKPIAVWALLGNSSIVSGNYNDTFEQVAKRVESALVLKFSIDNKIEPNKKSAF